MTDTVTPQRRLFRPESLQARELAWQGRPAVVLGLPAAFTTFASVALAAAVAALMVFGSYARRVDMEGTVQPSVGVVAVSTPSAGWIAALAVREGETVGKGTLLYKLYLDTATKGGNTEQQVINAQTAAREMLTQQIDRKGRMSAERHSELQQKIENLKAQTEQLRAQITMQQGFLKIITKEYNLFLGLVARRQASLNELDSRQQAWMQSQSKLQELESSKLRLGGELNDAQYQLTTITISTADEIDALKSKVLEIDERLANSEAHRLIEIRAPEAGTVTAIVGHAGQMVDTGAPILKIVPAYATMHAELLAPSRGIGFIREGERVLLRYSAFPYQKFGEYWGTIVNISQAALRPDEVESLRAGAPAPKERGPFYRVIVKPDDEHVNVYGEPRPLPAGMQVQAYALLEARPLYQWAVEPLYNVGHAAHSL